MARRGLNCTLSYSDGSRLRRYRVRCDMVSKGTTMVYEESQGRTVRAFYPHQTAESPFQIRAVLIGQAERKHFTDWLDGYASFVLDRDLSSSKFPPMLVSVPSRRFLKSGVPLTGFEYGDHVGAMVWNHVLTFESVPTQVDPKRTSRQIGKTYKVDPAASYFYPFDAQLTGDKAPQVYTQILTALAEPDTVAQDEDPTTVVYGHNSTRLD